MKKFIGLFILPLMFSISSCKDGGVTAIAYVRYAPQGEEYFHYTSYMYPTSHGHIVVYDNEEEAQKEYGQEAIMISFHKAMGTIDASDGYNYILSDLSERARYMQVSLYKGSELYSASKKLYLNGVELTNPSYTSDLETLISYTYEFPNFIRTNPNGHIDESLVNTIEYK